MTMHLLPAYFTTTNTKKKKPKLKKSDIEHQTWLAKKGLLPEQLKKKKSANSTWIVDYANSIKVERKYASAEMKGSSDSCAKKDIMSNLHKEPEHVRKEILDKASRVMPLYNKGGLQYATPETDMKSVGTKSRRG